MATAMTAMPAKQVEWPFSGPIVIAAPPCAITGKLHHRRRENIFLFRNRRSQDRASLGTPCCPKNCQSTLARIESQGCVTRLRSTLHLRSPGVASTLLADEGSQPQPRHGQGSDVSELAVGTWVSIGAEPPDAGSGAAPASSDYLSPISRTCKSSGIPQRWQGAQTTATVT